MRTKWLLIVLCAGIAGCATSKPHGSGLALFSSGQPLAEGLFSTFIVLKSVDDCRKLDLPGIDCTKNVWDFDGTTLEVDAPPGFEVLAQGTEYKGYWFSIRCRQAPPERKGKLTVRVKDSGGIRYQGTSDIACARPTELAVRKLEVGDNGRPGFSETVELGEADHAGIPVLVDAQLHTEMTARGADGQELVGYGRELESVDGAFVLVNHEQPPSEPGGTPPGPVLTSKHAGAAPKLRLGTSAVLVPVRAVADSDWKLSLSWTTDEHGTHVDAKGLLASGARVRGLTNCDVILTDAAGEKPAQTGDCKQYWLVPNVKKVCVRTRGKEACR